MEHRTQCKVSSNQLQSLFHTKEQIEADIYINLMRQMSLILAPYFNNRYDNNVNITYQFIINDLGYLQHMVSKAEELHPTRLHHYQTLLYELADTETILYELKANVL